MGDKEEVIVQMSRNTGAPLPERILNAPELFEGLQFYLEAFFDLDSERHHGNGLMRIPWSAMLNYASYYEMDTDMTDRFLYLMKRMDAYQLKALRAEQKARMNSNNSKGKINSGEKS